MNMMMMINHGQVNYKLSCVDGLLLPSLHAFILLTFYSDSLLIQITDCADEGSKTRLSATRQGMVAITQQFAC